MSRETGKGAKATTMHQLMFLLVGEVLTGSVCVCKMLAGLSQTFSYVNVY